MISCLLEPFGQQARNNKVNWKPPLSEEMTSWFCTNTHSSNRTNPDSFSFETTVALSRLVSFFNLSLGHKCAFESWVSMFYHRFAYRRRIYGVRFPRDTYRSLWPFVLWFPVCRRSPRSRFRRANRHPTSTSTSTELVYIYLNLHPPHSTALVYV